MSHKHLRRVSMWYSKPINWTGLEQKQNQIKFQISKVTWVCAGREGAGGPVEGFPSQVSRRTLSMWGTFFLSEFFLITLFFCQNFPFWEFFYLSQVLSIISILLFIRTLLFLEPHLFASIYNSKLWSSFSFSKIFPIESTYLKYLGKHCERFMSDLLSTYRPQRNSHFHDVGHRILIENIPFGRYLSIIWKKTNIVNVSKKIPTIVSQLHLAYINIAKGTTDPRVEFIFPK